MTGAEGVDQPGKDCAGGENSGGLQFPEGYQALARGGETWQQVKRIFGEKCESEGDRDSWRYRDAGIPGIDEGGRQQQNPAEQYRCSKAGARAKAGGHAVWS